MRKAGLVLACLALCLVLEACVPGSAASVDRAHTGGAMGRFLLGLWHGLIAPLTVILEVVNGLSPGMLPWPVHIYQGSAQGVAYDLGFYIGIAASPLVVWSRRR